MPQSPVRSVEYRGKSYYVSLAYEEADLLPWALDDGDFESIVESMKRIGFDPNHPIVRTPDGRVVEGRRRELAARVAGVKPVYKRRKMTREEIADHVETVELNRRNLTASQRAMAIVRLRELRGRGRPAGPDKSAPVRNYAGDLAAEAGVGARTIEDAAKVKRQAPELFDAVKEKGLPVKTAAKVADLDGPARQRVAQSKAPKEAAKEELAKAAGKRGDENPFAELLAEITKLAGAVTKAVKDESDHGKKLHAYMGLCGLLTHEKVGQKGATLVALRGVYAVVKAAGEKKVLSDKAVKAVYDKASGGWVPPLHARRKKQKTAPASGGATMGF